jgi:hypothetical protein
MMRRRVALDLDAGFLAGAFGAVYAALVGLLRGGFPGRMSGIAFGVLVVVYAVAGLSVGSVIAGRPDFGPTRRAALVRGFVAAMPVYAAGGLLFLPPERWFTLVPIVSLVAAAIVGPPIGIFMYRLHRRVDAPDAVDEPGVQLAWLKGELAGSWLPLLVSIAVLAALGVGMRAVPAVDPDALRQRVPIPAIERVHDLHRSVASDSVDPALRHQLGLVLTSLGGFRDAVGHLTVATTLDSANAEYWRALGRANYFAGDYARATESYWNAMRLDPTTVPIAGIDRAAVDASLALMLRERWGDDTLRAGTRPR